MNICQSCGMPLEKDPQNGGTNQDKSKSEKYCSFCYRDGIFLDGNITLNEKIERNVRLAVEKFNMTESQAREIAVKVLPGLERWR